MSTSFFVLDRASGTTIAVSVAIGGGPGNAPSDVCVLSPDGRYVEFSSLATNLVPNDTNNERDGFVRDRLLGTTTRITVSSTGVVINGGGHAGYPSADGRFATFVSLATNLVPRAVPVRQRRDPWARMRASRAVDHGPNP